MDTTSKIDRYAVLDLRSRGYMVFSPDHQSPHGVWGVWDADAIGYVAYCASEDDAERILLALVSQYYPRPLVTDA